MYRRYLDYIMPDNNSKVTITLRELVAGGMVLFDTDDPYPIWDEKHRPELEKKILEHYAFRQIGFETAGRFKFELNKKMREIMPYYNKIWATTQYNYNPIENYNMREGATDLVNHNENGKTGNLSKYSDTPQGSIERLDKYLTSATEDNGTHDLKSDGKTVHEAHRSGNIGVTTTQQMIEQERKATIDVDMQIIDALKDLFLGVY